MVSVVRGSGASDGAVGALAFLGLLSDGAFLLDEIEGGEDEGDGERDDDEVGEG